MSLLKVLKTLISSPLTKHQKLKTLKKFFLFQMFSKFFRFPYIIPFVENTFIVIRKGVKASTANFYLGLHEFTEMSFLLHFLKEGDYFVDAGANIGAFSILASGVKKAKSLAIEPIPKTFDFLQENISINKLQNLVDARNCGLSKEKDKCKFSFNLDSCNHVLNENDISNEFIMIDVEKLDDIVTDIPVLIKIDVEGFEHEVLKGSSHILKNEKLKAIIIEFNSLGLKYGFPDESIHKYLLTFNFKPYLYNALKRDLHEQSTFVSGNNLYLRDIEFVNQRIKTSVKIEINSIIY